MNIEIYPEYKSSGIDWLGEIPSHWECVKSQYLFSLGSGETINGEDFAKDGIYPVYGGNGIRGYHNKFNLEGEHILIGRVGALCGNIHYTPAKSWVSEHALILSPIKQFNLHYLGELLRVMNLGQYSMASAQPVIAAGNVGQLYIPIPPIDEQEVIAAYLDDVTGKVDALIAEKKKQLEDLRAYRTSLITETVTRGLNPNAPLRPSGIDWLGDIPQHWIISPLKYLLSQPLMYGANESPDGDVNKKHPRYIRITDISENGTLREETYRTLDEEKAKPYILQYGDILFARSGATVGKTYRFIEKYPCCFAGYLIKATCAARLDSKFFQYYTNSLCYQNWKNSIFDQSTIQNISAEKYNLLSTPVPPIDEQQAIAAFLDEKTAKIDALIDELTKQLDELAEYKKAVISEAVTGKVDVRDWKPNN